MIETLNLNKIFTIGHSRHSSDVFIKLLKLNQIDMIADVRSSPYSKFVSQFNKDVLAMSLDNAGINYVFLGRELGARREEESCYIGGKAQYSYIKKLPLFREGLNHLLYEAKENQIALMCSESDPLECHRTILISRELRELRSGIKILHILEDGKTESHADAENRLVKIRNIQPDLFSDTNSLARLVNTAYDLQANRIAYQKTINEL